VKTVMIAASLVCVAVPAKADLTLANPRLQCETMTGNFDYAANKFQTVTWYLDIDLDKMTYRSGLYKSEYTSDHHGTVVDLMAAVIAGPSLVFDRAKLLPEKTGSNSYDIMRNGGEYNVWWSGKNATCRIFKN
jgi:hypothetical protein